jgi:mycothiol system anti-sigma-R factor
MQLKEASPKENKMTCEAATSAVHEFLDHELPELRHAAVRAHIEDCPTCWRKFEFEKELRSVIWEKGQGGAAPSYLLDRVKRNLFETGKKAPRERRSLSALVPKLSWGWGVAVVALIVVGTVWVVLTGGPTATPLVAELVGDHILYASAEKPSEMISSNAEEIEIWLEAKLGYSINVPQFEGPELHLLGGRLINLQGKKIAYLIYGNGTHILSLYVTKVSNAELCADNRLQLQDCRLCLANIQNCEFCLTKHNEYTVLSWHENDVTYAMISDLDSEYMLDVTCPPGVSG